ncbi:serine protease [Mycolicibacterium agri]|uniref:Serine protease n=1 Tax=Mycolicibacterium agri TaxID=36811 RepID=A0A2A7N6L3_MYCAG|nr:S1C family serine protease [Mycolicibacterium agri]PEG39131.1 serine protease [Mycolicibacterium agri]GFG53939.1 trypsin [Mycolicibacterium agri]
MARLHWYRLLIAFAAVMALVAPIRPAIAGAAPLDTAISTVEPAVVQIDTTIDYQHAVGAGTGIVLNPNGEVLTNFHVVQGADVMTGHNVGTGQSFPMDLLGYDRTHDIALVQLRGASGLPVAPLGNSDTVSVGDLAVAIGNANPGGPPTREAGTITQLNRTIEAKDSLTGSSDELNGLIEVAANVRAGDSGGPLVNEAGQVIGVTTAATVNYRFAPGGKGLAIPINQALAIADQIRSRVPSDTVHIGPPTLLGVGVAAGDQDPDAPGVVIREALRGGPADQAGLVDGDILTSINGQRLNSATELTRILDRYYPGDVVDLTWIDRTGQQRTGKATLVAGP